MSSSDGKTRDLVSTMAGAGWDYSLSRHPYHEIERPLGPHYCVYNRRLMACCFDSRSTEDGYWLLRRKAAVLHTGEFPLQFGGPDAERLLDRLFTKDITKLKPGRCAYGLACYEDGGLLVDGILLRLEPELFWYAQADGDFYSWARAHALGMDVEISDPRVYVSQVQGPNSLKVLAAASDDGMPEPFGYFAIARVRFGGQPVVITRTGYTNELGWEYYTEPGHDAEALWRHIEAAGEPFGIELFGLDAMHIRRIEAGILNAGSDFDHTTTPYEVGLGKFIDADKSDFIGRQALLNASRETRLTGLRCAAEPHIGGEVCIDGQPAGKVTAGAVSPYLRQGIGIALMSEPGFREGDAVTIRCIDGEMHAGEIAELPLYDKACEIPRGKLVDIPQRD
ncbi:MAG: aminomethyltransferase family protein [Gammaproteobacteria bacterium]|nr:aminomethyltransferase family protein [Gammaproteobacteria bacterium]MDH3448132.1 aminomethyltransferase family protein [Gammaproteobacteria bacterium]